MTLKNPPHPGLAILEDCLAPFGLTLTKTAQILGISRKQLSAIINGRAGISPEMAIRLDKAFGGGAEAWYQLQARFDFAIASQNADHIKVSRYAA